MIPKKPARRSWMHFGCALCFSIGSPTLVFGQNAATNSGNPWKAPARFIKPGLDTDEGGLWAMMDREEIKLRRSPFIIKDSSLQRYITELTLKLAGEHAPDVRVHLLRTPYFNASMAPNGMMQVWSGLMLRIENEAQLCAVLGHELGHYFEQHTLNRLRDIKSKSALASVMALFGPIGSLGALATLSSAMAFGREQESDADRIGLELLAFHGYRCEEASSIWRGLTDEMSAGDRKTQLETRSIFATHPAIPDRILALEALSKNYSGGEVFAKEWFEKIAPHRVQWILDEVERGQFNESEALFTRLLRLPFEQPEVQFARAEVRRVRGREVDVQAVLDELEQACAHPKVPAHAFKSLGLAYRAQSRKQEAVQAFEAYLTKLPAAPDGPLIQSFIGELKT